MLRNDLKIEILVDGCRVVESESEKLLGIIINNTMTWHNHLYGNIENKGLIDKLSHRAGMINKLSKVMPKHRLKTIAEGIFFSILNYGIEVYGNVWGIVPHDDQSRRSTAFTKEDNRRLQILVNKVLRCLTGLDREISTVELHKKSNQLSVHQRSAFFSILAVYKAIHFKQPSYHYLRLVSANDARETRNKSATRIEYNLSISRCSFFFRASRLYDLLPLDLRRITSLTKFKRSVKKWTRQHIPLLPS